MTVLRERVPGGSAAAPGGTIERYRFGERLLHWFVALTFIALMLSGFALGYPRAAFLSGLFGGGQTMRFLHPWIGVAFTLGVAGMFVAWAKDMRATPDDKVWRRRLRMYMREGHSGLDTARYNSGQKGYFWLTVYFTVALLVTGLALWDTDIVGRDPRNAARLIHHAVFLFTVGGFIIHVYLSTVMFPGTIAAMTTGRVSRAWAAWHHPKWFREQDGGGTGPKA
ncbi:MAG TPA: formate dehydrogenase subunit gamma [Acidimicrobiia bacterium]|nr:formate dehydrogenase subunit gamma [Acidimicrobiia bacterium]